MVHSFLPKARCFAPCVFRYRTPLPYFNWYSRTTRAAPTAGRGLATEATNKQTKPQDRSISEHVSDSASESTSTSSSSSSIPLKPSQKDSAKPSGPPAPDWEENPNFDISHFSELPHTNFGVNQHMVINDEFKEALRQIPWQFKAPIRYAFAYGSGVFPQSKPSAPSSSATSIHPKPPPAVVKAQGGQPKMIDFIFGVSYTEHWHSLNLSQHRDHYSLLGSLGSGVVSAVQDNWGAGVYFNPYVTVNGTMIKYGVVNLDTLCKDLSEWTTLYIAGRLHKPVKILRDEPRVRLANQVNLISALRTAMLLLPETFTERELYGTIASISYMGDPRMSMPTEDPGKIANIVGNNLSNFRRLYSPLVENLPNIDFNDPACNRRGWQSDPNANVKLQQDMDPVKRGNMVRRLPIAFRGKLYFQYQRKFQIPQLEFDKMLEESTDEDATSFKRREGGRFEQRIGKEAPEDLGPEVRGIIKKTVNWPSTSQSLKSFATAGVRRSWRYMREKSARYQEGKRAAQEKAKDERAKEEKPKKEKSKAEDEKAKSTENPKPT